MATKATVPTVANGDSWSAAQHNTYLRDNIEALWPYTTAGDLAYASAANQLARLGIGTAYQFMQTISGAPAWGGLHFATVNKTGTQNFSTGVAAAVTFDAEQSDVQGWHSTSVNTSRITVSATGFYQANASLEYAAAGGSGNYWDTIEIRVGGSTVIAKDRRWQNVDAYNKKFAISAPIVQLGAGEYVEVWLEQNAGGTYAVQAGAFFSVLRVS